MFPSPHFAPVYFAPRYFAKIGSAVPSPVPGRAKATVTGANKAAKAEVTQ